MAPWNAASVDPVVVKNFDEVADGEGPLWVTGGCEDSVSATDGLPPAADTALQRSD